MFDSGIFCWFDQQFVVSIARATERYRNSTRYLSERQKRVLDNRLFLHGFAGWWFSIQKSDKISRWTTTNHHEALCLHESFNSTVPPCSTPYQEDENLPAVVLPWWWPWDTAPRNRSFYVQVPTGLGARPAPLLIALHAQGFQADSVLAMEHRPWKGRDASGWLIEG